MTHRDLLDLQLDLSERLLLVVVEIGKGELEDSSSQRIGRVLCERCQSISHKCRRGQDALIPWVRLTRVLPTFLFSKKPGALMSYHSAWNQQAIQDLLPLSFPPIPVISLVPRPDGRTRTTSL